MLKLVSLKAFIVLLTKVLSKSEKLVLILENSLNILVTVPAEVDLNIELKLIVYIQRDLCKNKTKRYFYILYVPTVRV